MRRRRLAALLAATAIATGAASAAAVAPAAAATAAAPMQPVIVRLKAQADMSGITGTRAERLREVIRRRRAIADQGYGKLLLQVAAWQRQGKIAGITRFWVFNGFAASATQDVIDALAANSLVASVEPDATGTIVPASSVPAEPNIARIGAPPVWDGGDGGEGIVVATLDSGVDIDHPDLATSWRGGPDSWYDPFGQHPTTPMDRSGHGTQVMGVIAGAGYGGTAIGVAPGAKWIAARIFNDAGQGSLSATHLAFQWVLDPDRDPATADAPQVVNNSWTFASGGCNLEFAVDIQSLRAAGIVPVFAAGNFTSLSASPANNPGALAVGSTTATDTIAGDSSRGPSACGEASSTFPEITAPGVRITTADLGGFYASVTGTSIAAPHVTGALALMLSARPAMTVAQQEGILEGAALDLGAAGADNTFGFGRLDAHAAHDAVLALPPPADTTGPAVSAVAAAPNPVAAGTVALSASATDAAGIVSGAEWFDGADPGAGNGTAMYASDGAWDLLTETVRADIDAAGLAPGTHTISVRARDAAGNWGAPVATTLVVDRAGPAVSPVTASPNPVSSGGVTLTATAADGDTPVTAAEWFEGADPGAGNGTALAAADGAFDTPSETLTGTVAADGLAPGAHTISVRARDAAGNWGAPVATTLVVDRVAPDTSAVAVSPNPVASADVTLTATAADALTSVAAAEWFEGADPGAGHGTAMTAADGAFGASTEGLRAVVPTAALAPGAHTLSVRARDAAGNWGVPVAVALTIDRTGPAASSVTATPSPTAGAATIALGATLAEPAGSAVVAAEWFDGADPGAGRGAAMAAADGAFGGATESVTASVPTAGMAPGTHVLSVRGRDAAGNWGPAATVSVSVSASNAIFADGFETGLGAWSSVSGGSRVAATAAARSQGALGMQATVSGSTPAYVQDASPANEATYVATFAFKPNGTTTNGNPTDILSALSGGTSPAQVLAVQYRRVTGPVRLQLRLSVARKSGTTTTGWYTVGEAWHTVGVTWSSGTSASAALRIDGATAETLTRLDTSARRVETARLGPSGGLASGMAGTEYFDAFTSTR